MQIQYGGAEQQQKEQKLRLEKENLFLIRKYDIFIVILIFLFYPFRSTYQDALIAYWLCVIPT